MRIVRIQGGKKFQVNIDDTFSGDSIIIDSHYQNNKPLTKKGYLALEAVQNIINSDKPLGDMSQE